MDIYLFWNLLNKKSKFQQWYTNNISVIDNLSSNKHFDNKINKYIQVPIDQFADAVQITLERMSTTGKNIPKIETTHRQAIKLSTEGGDNNNFTKEQIKDFIGAIPLYLFGEKKIENLPEPREKMHPNTNINFKDLSGTKASERLVFIIEIDEHEYILKIAPSQERFVKEIEIYKELTNASNKHLEIKNKIIKIFGGGQINKGEEYEIEVSNKKIKIDKKNNFLVFDKIQELFRTNAQNNTIVYSVLEYDKKYKNLWDSNDKIKDKCDLVYNILKTVNFLNKNYGFSHLDLHLENILVNPDDIKEFKLYDFDISTTHANPNNYYEVINIIVEQYSGIKVTENNILRPDVGFSYDFYRFVERFMHKNNDNLECSSKSKKLIEIFKKYPVDPEAYIEEKDNYPGRSYFVDLWGSMIPLIKNEEYKNISSILNTENKVQRAGYFNKYMKYKSKYLLLKNKI